MAKGNIGANTYKAFLGNLKMKKGYIGATRVYSAGNTVTYVMDTNISYQEEVDSEASCLSPKTFTPTKSGWTFVGWRENNTANSTVLTSKVMGDNPITLYAVFRQLITVTYYNNSTTRSTKTGYRYYNNGNTVNPSFTLTQASRSGWTARGWSTGTAGNSSITYNNATAFTRSSNITLYGCYNKNLTLGYNGNGNTGGSTTAQTGIQYYNSAGNTTNPSFTLRSNGFTKTNYGFVKWILNSTSGTAYAAGASITLSANATMFAQWIRTADFVNDPSYVHDGSGNTIDLTFTRTTAWGENHSYTESGNDYIYIDLNGYKKATVSYSVAVHLPGDASANYEIYVNDNRVVKKHNESVEDGKLSNLTASSNVLRFYYDLRKDYYWHEGAWLTFTITDITFSM
ncbi:MAG: InlB B-repeat-containing protein [Lachnospiraceae bacterium]|nr:InlB B-repeat-containing protein [Lachnospiraceae bacterium]